MKNITIIFSFNELIVKLLLLVSLCLAFHSCEDFVSVDLPSSRITQQGAFDNDQTAIASALGMYSSMCRLTGFAASGGSNSVTTLAAFSADEFDSFVASNKQFIENNLEASNPAVLSLWTSAYNLIYTANMTIEGITGSGGLSEGVKMQLEGEARFIRAFCYFYLVNLFGDVPLVLETDYRSNASVSRSPSSKVYSQILDDLLRAKDLLSPDYMSATNAVTTARHRPNRSAAVALLARTYLYLGDWENAEQYSTEVINESARYSLAGSLDEVFLANSREAIWQLSHPAAATNSMEAIYFIATSTSVNQILSHHFLDAFEDGDGRKMKWIGTYTGTSNSFHFPYKYKVRSSTTKTEHTVVLRLAEQFLIRAEARAQLDKLSGSESAESDINLIRHRAGLPDVVFGSKEDMLNAIYKERRVELFAEWGHRWFDLRRTGKADQVLGSIKPAWSEQDLLYPVPDNELKLNPNLAPQNSGY